MILIHFEDSNMFKYTKISPTDIQDYIVRLTNDRMKNMENISTRLELQKKDEVFYANALISIQSVINHFDIVEEAFEHLSIESLTAWADHNYYLRFYVDYMFEAPDKPPKYMHYFDVYDFKTKYVINPLAKKLKTYTTQSECTVSLTKEGLLKEITFSEAIHSHDNKKIEMTYNSLFELSATSRSYHNNLTGKTIIKHKSYCESLEDEAYFIDLFLNNSYTKLLEHLPELTIPSAYNFNSDEFNIRLKVAEMISI